MKSIFRLVKCIHIYTYWLYFLQIGLFIHIHIYMHIFIYMYSSSSPSRLLPIFESTHISLILGLGEVVVLLLKVNTSGLPWWRSGWESACQCRGYGFRPWSGRIPHAAEQLGPWATTAEPARLEPVLRNKRGRDSERPAHRDEEWPPLASTRESPRTETKTQHSHK